MNKHSARHSVGVVGFRGYSGAELIRILERHSGVDVVLLEHRSEADARPQPLGTKGLESLPATPDAMAQHQLDLVFLATPPEVSMELAPAILEKGIRVIDLSGAFRLGHPDTHARWYKERHTAPELYARAVYGLPEFYRDRIRGAEFISNPGCYPTAANLAIRPLVCAGAVDRGHEIICDAKSGVSGAGRKPSLKTSFCEVADNFSAYGVLDHRHVPEVLQHSGIDESEFCFTAHLLPLDRGILETIYVRTDGVRSAADLLAIYERAYGSEPFVRLYPEGKLPDLQGVQRTNFCDIGFVFDAKRSRAVIVSTVDNLVKGAAGQAVQNMNLVLGYPETESLL